MYSDAFCKVFGGGVELMGEILEVVLPYGILEF